MATKKVKKKQIKDFAHKVDSVGSHKPATEQDKGKLVRANKDTGEIEFVRGTRVVDISGYSGYINNVDADYQVEFYRRKTGTWTLINLFHNYSPTHKHLYWQSQIEMIGNDSIAVIKQV